jgi:hypothetical protein
MELNQFYTDSQINGSNVRADHDHPNGLCRKTRDSTVNPSKTKSKKLIITIGILLICIDIAFLVIPFFFTFINKLFFIPSYLKVKLMPVIGSRNRAIFFGTLLLILRNELSK